MNIFVDQDKVNQYKHETIELAIRHRRSELIEAKWPADAQIPELEMLSERLEKAFKMAENAYRNCSILIDQVRMPYFCYRVQIAYLVASRSFASYEGIILALLAPAAVKFAPTQRIIRVSFDDIKLEFGESCVSLLSDQERFPVHPGSEEVINEAVFEYCAEHIFASIKDEIQRHHDIVNLSIVDRAYGFAKRKHHKVFRHSGEPYIMHPLYVALILAQNGLDCDIIAAALLHDVVQDARPRVSINQIKEVFNSTIASYVDAVTSVGIERFANDPTAYHSYELDRAQRDEASFNKLKAAVEASPEMVGALYIKAADRIHNLLTLDAVSEQKLFAKIDETESMYLNLFKEYHLNRFVQIIEDECLRYTDPIRYQKIERNYLRILNNSQAELRGYDYYNKETGRTEHFGGLHELIENYIASFNSPAYFKKMLDNPIAFKVDYKAVPFYPCEVNKMLPSASFVEDMVITKRNIHLEKFYVILSSSQGSYNLKNFIRFFMMNYQKGLAEKGYIIDELEFKKDFNQYCITVVDPFFNKIDVIITMREDYTESLYGSFYLDKTSSKASDNLAKIGVFTPDGKVINLLPGSTVLDFAYYVHTRLCLEAIDGIVNGRRRNLNAELHDGNTVYIRKSPYDYGSAPKKGDAQQPYTPRATVEYLKYTKNPDVQRYLISYLSQKYDGDNTKLEEVVDNEGFQNHLTAVFENNLVIKNMSEQGGCE